MLGLNSKNGEGK